MNIVFDGTPLDKAAADVCKHILADAVCPTKLFKIHWPHNNVLDIPHRERRDPLKLSPKHRPREDIAEAPVLDQRLHERDDLRILLYFIDKDKRISLNKRCIRKKGHAVDKVNGVLSANEHISCLGIEQQIGLKIRRVVVFTKRANRIALANLTRTGNKQCLMRVIFPVQKPISDLTA